MIISIHTQATSEERAQLMTLLCRITGSQRPITTTMMTEREVIALDGTIIDAQAQTAINEQSAVDSIHTLKTPYQLASRLFQATSTSITIGTTHDCEPVTIGGTASPVIMSGPCAVESREQLISTARAVKEAGAQVLRGGAFKPRTSPYQFQGLGIEGLHMLSEAREVTGLPVISEVMEPDMVDTVAQHVDILQVGARNMQNYPLLMSVGRHARKLPVLLKRGLSSTIDEWLLAAEYIIAAGNPNVILCERGIRSYDPMTRNVLDLTCIPLLHELTHLPVIADPSHSTGRRELVPVMSRAAIAAEADGLIIETHIDPDRALCDGRQSITPAQLEKIVHETRLLTQLMKGDVRVA
ncbi:3-deoxy-7-phosphoheptulonate synthase [Tengunoibacter tsumagoiensis]|uniref:3-deoxy-7-phosphoheptulonate synthase n=1 Tax=Tengunoibacter tsumagoiensis TaxID=2014871 RepID=A0A401ZTX8_9CHLR|nr:3-deoxy-7-phosphoheptulonate synthase [Tengunoibacter tsumagoiensis]GCE10246.1 3-deoxy-7-phosphoheptulonate synthase [Tengunoibacter tsumagoiensis]